MALIKCPECGREISDKAVSCPGCGCPASYFKKNTSAPDVMPESEPIGEYSRGIKPWGYHAEVSGTSISQEQLDKIADEVYAKCSNDQYKWMAIFRGRTNTDLETARNMMFLRFHGATQKELDMRKKMFRNEKTKRIFGTDSCPKCGSKYIESFCEQGVSVTSESSLFGGMFITHPGNVNQGLKCMYCGYRWNPFKKK